MTEMIWKPISSGRHFVDKELICMDEEGSVFSARYWPDENGGGEWFQYETDLVHPKWWLCVVPEKPKTLENMTFSGKRIRDMDRDQLMHVIEYLHKYSKNSPLV